MVVRQDADLEACQRSSRLQVMTVYKPVEKMSQRAAQVCGASGRESRCRKRCGNHRE